MAKVIVVPVIRREDYNAFQRDVGPTLANSYDEWTALFSAEVDSARQQGKTVVETEVRYGEFIRYCIANGLKPDPMTLLDFVGRQKRLGEA